MGIPEVFYTITVVVRIEVVLNAIRVEVARPNELIYPAVIVVILIIGVWSRTVVVIIGHAIIVMI